MTEWDATDWQALFDERAAISEYDGGMTRALAELGAYGACVAEYLARHQDKNAKTAKIALAGFGVRYPKV